MPLGGQTPAPNAPRKSDVASDIAICPPPPPLALAPGGWGRGRFPSPIIPSQTYKNKLKEASDSEAFRGNLFEKTRKVARSRRALELERAEETS